MRDGYDSGWVGAAEGDDLDRRLAAEETEEAFDLAQPHVMTALGPIAPDELGPTLVGEGIGGRGPGEDDPHAPLAALEDYANAGGRAFVDLATADAGGDAAAARWVAARAPVHVVLATGLAGGEATARFLAARGWTTVEAVAAWLVGELTEGIGGTGARAGVIAVGGGAGAGAATDSIALRAAVRAQRAVGAPILLRSSVAGAPRLLDALRGEGVAPGRVIVGGFEAGDGEGARLALERGAFAALGAGDGAGGGDSVEATVAHLWHAGYGERVLLAAPSAAPARGPGFGLADLMQRLPLRLMVAGLAASAVRRLLVENPARALTIAKGEA